MSAYLRYACVGSKRTPDIATERTNVGSLGAFANQVECRKFLAGAAFSHFALANHLEFANVNLAGFQFNVAATFHQVAGTNAIDFHGAVLGRNLFDIPRKLRENRFQASSLVSRL